MMDERRPEGSGRPEAPRNVDDGASASGGAGANAARLVLPGFGSAPVTVEVRPRPRRGRLLGAILILAVSIALMPVVFFVPPHVLWPLVSLVGGSWLAWRTWRGEYEVIRFEGSCPRCGTDLELGAGARIGPRHTLECYGCHRQPELVLGDPE